VADHREPTSAGLEHLLEMRGIHKSYGPIVACNDASLLVESAQIHALLGENGAGKTTLMRVLFGHTRPESGSIRWRGARVEIGSPRAALELGIGMVHQHDMLVPTFSVVENFELAGSAGAVLLDPRGTRERIERLAEEFAIPVDPDARAEDLTVAQRQWLSLLRVLAERVALVVLDEITSNVTSQERDRIFGTLRRLRDEGISTVLITHKLDEVFAVADRVTVMRAGRAVAALDVADATHDLLAELIVGHQVESVGELPDPVVGEVLLRVAGLSLTGAGVRLDDIDLEIREGEVVGIAGIDGNGQRELVECLCGLRAPEAGSVEVAGVDLAGADARRFIAEGVARIPEDRHLHGLALGMAVWENLHLGKLLERGLVRRGVLDRSHARERATRLMGDFGVRARDIDQLSHELSGGNQQKVILARELGDGPSLVVAMNPARGLDIGATQFVHDQIGTVRAAGGGVLLVSFDLDELIGVCDRLLVMSGGRIVGESRRGAHDRVAIGMLMAGARGAPPGHATGPRGASPAPPQGPTAGAI
jgi:simple sugar transport system ATP-binding protein